MRKWFMRLENQIDVLSMRERGLVFLSGTAVVFLIWTFLLFDPQNDELESLNTRMQGIQQTLNARAQEATVLAQSVDVNVDRTGLERLADLLQQSAALEQRMSELNVELIPASELLDVVRDVLEQSNKLTIERIEYLPPKQFVTNRTATSGVFKHTVELTLEGTWFDLLEYLTGLEQLPWRLYWDGLDYQVSQYPVGEIQLSVSTLSTSEVMFENL